MVLTTYRFGPNNALVEELNRDGGFAIAHQAIKRLGGNYYLKKKIRVKTGIKFVEL